MAIEYLKRGISDQKRSEDDANTAKIVSQTLLDIEERGDRAVRELAVKFDGFDRDNYKLSQTEIEQIISKVSDDDMRDLKFAQEQVRNFAEAQRESMRDIEIETMPGVILGHKNIPVQSVGCYIPGGRYSHIASAIMTVTTAKVAGCEHITVCSVPQPGEGVNPAIVFAAQHFAKVLVFRMRQVLGAASFILKRQQKTMRESVVQ